MEIKEYKANGKLLLTGEYFVLDGAKALALPCKYGQKMSVAYHGMVDDFSWESFDEKNESWFQGSFDKNSLSAKENSDQHIAERLEQIFKAIQKRNASIFKTEKGISINTKIDFPKAWGLGTSSTLIALLSEWAEVNPFELLNETFGGSGYDIACATAQGPILYKKTPLPKIKSVVFEPNYRHNLFFVYLGQKQNSREGIAHYKTLGKVKENLIKEVSNLTEEVLVAKDLSRFEEVILEHENLVSKTLKMETVQKLHFADYEFGTTKSLGAWGGDFILATSKASVLETKKWFDEKGYPVCIPFKEMVL